MAAAPPAATGPAKTSAYLPRRLRPAVVRFSVADSRRHRRRPGRWLSGRGRAPARRAVLESNAARAARCQPRDRWNARRGSPARVARGGAGRTGGRRRRCRGAAHCEGERARIGGDRGGRNPRPAIVRELAEMDRHCLLRRAQVRQLRQEGRHRLGSARRQDVVGSIGGRRRRSARARRPGCARQRGRDCEAGRRSDEARRRAGR